MFLNLWCVFLAVATVCEELTGNLLLFAQLTPGPFLLLFQALVHISQDFFVGSVGQRDLQTVPVHWLGHVHWLCHVWMDRDRRSRGWNQIPYIYVQSKFLLLLKKKKNHGWEKLFSHASYTWSNTKAICAHGCLAMMVQQRHLLVWGHFRPRRPVILHQPSE